MAKAELPVPSDTAPDNSGGLGGERGGLRIALVALGEIATPATIVGLLCQFYGVEPRLTAGFSLAVVLLISAVVFRGALDSLASGSTYVFGAIVLGFTIWYLTQSSGVDRQVGLVSFERHANDFLAIGLHKEIENAKSEIVFFGTSFHISAADKGQLILDALNRGVRVRYLVVDFRGPNVPKLADDFGVSLSELVQQGESSLESVRVLALRWKSQRAGSPNSGQLEVRLFDSTPRMRAYVFDGARGFIVPYMNSMNSARTPGFLFVGQKEGVLQSYYSAINQVWNNSQPWNGLP